MCRNSFRIAPRRQQQGLGLVGAVFVIVVVALLAVAMAKMLEADKLSQSYEILGLKAFLAAESGAQLGVNRLLAPESAGACVNVNQSFTARNIPNVIQKEQCEHNTDINSNNNTEINTNGQKEK